MISKNEVKYIQSLFLKKNRDAGHVFIAETPKLVDELLQSDFKVLKIYTTKPVSLYNQSAELINITEAELERISKLQTPHEMLAVIQQKHTMPATIHRQQMTLVLDGIQDPGNMGTIIRTADWFGITNIIASNDTVDVYNPKVVQATMGSIARVNVSYASIADVLTTVDVPVFGALLSGESIYEITKPNEGVLVIGNEAKGIRENVLPFVTRPVTIPRIGKAESLNAAVAAGIILSHLV